LFIAVRGIVANRRLDNARDQVQIENPMIGRPVATFLLVSTLFSANSAAVAQEGVAKARELYLSADYEGALAVLDRLEGEGATADAADYRLFCLLALDRSEDARTAIKAILEADPFHRLSETQASPRMLATFQATRKALLPEIVQQMYVNAKTLFERHDPGAIASFDRLIALLDDPDLKDAQLSDLRGVASGFRELSKGAVAEGPKAAPAAVAAAREAPRPEPAPAAPPAVAPRAIEPLTGPPDKIRVTSRGASPVFTPKEPPAPGFEPPLAINQAFPAWPGRGKAAQQTYSGVLEIAIDEEGNVTKVALQQAILPTFDSALMKAARAWKFKPALLDGTPVPFVKVIEIQIQPER
jgi:TonB family protein